MNILFITACFGLFKPKSGGRNRFYNLLFQLSKNNQIFIIQPYIDKNIHDNSLGEVSYFRTNIKGRTFNCLTDFNPFFILKLFKISKAKKIDIIQVSNPFGLVFTKILVKLMRKNIKIILDAHDVESDAVESQKNRLNDNISFFDKLCTFFYIFYVPIIEKMSVKCSDHILAVSNEDKRRFIEIYNTNEKKISVIPSGIVIRKNFRLKKCFGSNFSFDTKGRPKIFFHGSYFHPPNKEAVELIRNYIAPKIPEADFLIAGSGIPVFEFKNFKTVGFVEDLYSLMKFVDMAIVPIRRGSGTRLKILDYLMIGLPIVSTKKGIEGIKAENLKNAMIVDDVDEEFIGAVKYLIKNDEIRTKMAENNRRLAEEKYNYSVIGKRLNKLYNDILWGKNEN